MGRDFLLWARSWLVTIVCKKQETSIFKWSGNNKKIRLLDCINSKNKKGQINNFYAEKYILISKMNEVCDLEIGIWPLSGKEKRVFSENLILL